MRTGLLVTSWQLAADAAEPSVISISFSLTAGGWQACRSQRHPDQPDNLRCWPLQTDARAEPVGTGYNLVRSSSESSRCAAAAPLSALRCSRWAPAPVDGAGRLLKQPPLTETRTRLALQSSQTLDYSSLSTTYDAASHSVHPGDMRLVRAVGSRSRVSWRGDHRQHKGIRLCARAGELQFRRHQDQSAHLHLLICEHCIDHHRQLITRPCTRWHVQTPEAFQMGNGFSHGCPGARGRRRPGCHLRA